ncbi:MAG: peptidoglycan DD-metalloendopeptidase family protein [Roseiflexaceae bacterium]|nr:peptidoglycan DD-metalloendopeptidase family protein [Roseiflexaceae bacterium]
MHTPHLPISTFALIILVALHTLLAACAPPPQPSPTEVPLAPPVQAVLAATVQPVPTQRATAAPSATPAPSPTPEPAPFFDDQRLTYEPDFYAPQLQAWLDTQPGPLKTMSFVVAGRRHSFAEALISQTSYYSINPKVVVALLETQGGLVSTAQPTPEQLAWAAGFRKEEWRRGVQSQVRWAVRQMLFAKRDYPQRAELKFADDTSAPPPAGITLSAYVLAVALAPTATQDQLPALLDRFRSTYTRLFDDPRLPPQDWPAPAAPFLFWPMQRGAPVTSFFDHAGPFLTRRPGAPVLTYWGRDEIDAAFAYDGHDGWDYALAPPDLALAAAAGIVVFAGNADDNCGTRAVILDHGNGYRTLYWHLARVDTEIGQQVARGESLGMIGESGCATGPHLHFGVQFLGRNLDPYGWCGEAIDPWAAHPAGSVSSWLWADRPSPCAPPPPGSVVVDTDSPGFENTGTGWQIVTPGYGGAGLAVISIARPPAPTPTGQPSATPTPTPATPQPTAAPTTPTPTPRPARARWTARVPQDGRYRVMAYIPYALSGLNDARDVRYLVRSAEGQHEAVVNQLVSANEWADLGTYSFRADRDAVVSITNATESGWRTVWADAIIWLPIDDSSN